MIMHPIKRKIIAAIIGSTIIYSSCKVPALVTTPEQKKLPLAYANTQDTVNTATIQWRNFFTDKYLISLVDTALKNNQELLTTLKEIEIARIDIRVLQGQLLPFITGNAGIGVEKVGRYTSQGAGDASTV